MKLSVVATLYKSAPYIAEFYTRVSDSARLLVGEDYEIVLVNDGSPDNSLELAVQLTESDSHVVVVDLSRNFGHHKAIMAGLKYAKGDHVFLIDVDLEEKPELLITFWEALQTSKVDLVNGQQVQRKGGAFEVWSGHLFYKLINILSGIRIEPNLTMSKLMTRRFVDALISHNEKVIFFGGILEITGFDRKLIPCEKGHKGSTTYTFRRKLSQALISVVSFSTAPLQYVFWIGFLISVISSCYACLLILRRIIYSTIPDGWTSLAVIVSGFGGLIMLSIGIVGLYLAKIFEEVKARPIFIVRNVFGRNI